MPRASLRQLSRQFARRTIDKAEYRRRRAELIQELSAEQDSDMEPTGPTTDTPTGRQDETTPRDDGL